MTAFQSFYAVLHCEGSGATPADTRWQIRTQDGVILDSFVGTWRQASAWAETRWAARSNGTWPLYGCDRGKRIGLGGTRTFEVFR